MDGQARSRLIPDFTPGNTVITAAAGTAAVLGVVAVYSPKYAAAALLAAAFVAVAAWRLPLALAAFVLLTFPEHLPGSLGAGETLAKPMGALILVAWLGNALTRNRTLPLLPRTQPLLFWAIVGLILFSGVSTLWATDAGETRSALGRLLLVAGLAVVTYTAASSRAGFRTIVHGYLLGSVVTSLYSVGSGTYLAKGRLAGLFDPNYFAAELIPAILISCFLFVSADSRRKRWLSAAVAAIDLVAFALTQSRGGIVGLTVALLVAVVVAGRARPRVVALFLVLVAVGLGYYVTYKPAHVFQSGVGGLSATSSGRTDEWKVALRIAGGHPIGGVGLGNYRVVEPSVATQTLNLDVVRFIVRFRQLAHNTYLQVAAELGLVGLLLFLTILALPLRAAGRALAGLEQELDELEFHARGLLAGAIGLLTAYVFLSANLEKPLWFVVGLLASVPSLLLEDTT
ncbi:MAG TPA: O-antigen ligase family protein [Gaiellaceae bacterium]|nr:O-antigen ligase family protein [Gaiellaceae bacterium]